METDGQADCRVALSTLFEVLYTITKAMAPFTPFLTEYFYQNLRKILPLSEREDSVHYLLFPETVKEALNQQIEDAVSGMQTVIQLGRAARDRKTLPVKFPLTRITVIHHDKKFLEDIESLQGYILSELNVKELVRTSDESAVITTATGNSDILGKKLRKDFRSVDQKIQQLTHEEIKKLQKDGKMNIGGHEISASEIIITRKFNGDNSKHEAASEGDVIIVLDLEVDEKMREEGTAREVINRVQRLRKKAGIHPTDPIEVFYDIETTSELGKVVSNQKQFIMNGIGVGFVPVNLKPNTTVDILSDNFELGKNRLGLSICRLAFAFHEDFLSKCTKDTFYQDLRTHLLTRDYFKLLDQFKVHGAIEISLNGQVAKVELGKDLFPSASSLPS